MRQKANASGSIDEEELALEFRHVDYGRELVNGFVAAAGLQRQNPATPKRWRNYRCDDYFLSQLAVNGYFDESAQQWLIVTAEEVAEDVKAEFLQIGSPGADGIGFGYRNGQPGLWAYHCMTGQEFQWLARTAQQLLDGWMAGTITV
ncbi:MAG: hypothetical protein HY290_20615 [Planctomycetia bacterium]|nr:hypothetical protein [Planctomycetia bacterium]